MKRFYIHFVLITRNQDTRKADVWSVVVSRSSLVEMKGIVMMPKVLPDVLLEEELCGEVLSACAEEPVAVAQSNAQVFTVSYTHLTLPTTILV